MAVYVPPGRRRNLTAAIALSGVVAGLAAGFGLGRGTATSVGERVSGARSSAQELISALDALPFEYEQALQGQGSSEGRLIVDTVDRAAGRLPDALDEAAWFGDAQRARVTAAVAGVRDAARRRASPADFKREIDRADAVIRGEYGLPAGSGSDVSG